MEDLLVRSNIPMIPCVSLIFLCQPEVDRNIFSTFRAEDVMGLKINIKMITFMVSIRQPQTDAVIFTLLEYLGTRVAEIKGRIQEPRAVF